jgi:hypothetical protein
MSKKAEMQNFIANHKGETFTATGLARALGWIKTKKRKVKVDEDKEVEQAYELTYSGTARRIARKSGAAVSKLNPKDSKTSQYRIGL